jgi:hypothetical protein
MIIRWYCVPAVNPHGTGSSHPNIPQHNSNEVIGYRKALTAKAE